MHCARRHRRPSASDSAKLLRCSSAKLIESSADDQRMVLEKARTLGLPEAASASLLLGLSVRVPTIPKPGFSSVRTYISFPVAVTPHINITRCAAGRIIATDKPIWISAEFTLYKCDPFMGRATVLELGLRVVVVTVPNAKSPRIPEGFEERSR